MNKHIICNINNDIPFKIPSYPYVLVNKSILCNCGIEADNDHLLEFNCLMQQKDYQIDNVFHYQPSIHKLGESAQTSISVILQPTFTQTFPG